MPLAMLRGRAAERSPRPSTCRRSDDAVAVASLAALLTGLGLDDSSMHSPRKEVDDGVSLSCPRGLRASLEGQVIGRDHTDYDGARRAWNGAFDRFPLAVVRPSVVGDVQRTVSVASATLELTLAVRGGGHSLAGFSTCDDGIVLDLAGFNEVQVDVARARVRVAGGALLHDLIGHRPGQWCRFRWRRLAHRSRWADLGAGEWGGTVVATGWRSTTFSPWISLPSDGT